MKETAFWDSSALIPLCVDQTGSGAAKRFLQQYQIAVWWAAPVEMASAFARLLRMKDIDEQRLSDANRYVDELRIDWQEIDPSFSLRDFAEELPVRFGLRAADVLQLAAASVWTMHRPADRPFISGDQRLLDAARQMGFRAMAI